MLKLPKLEPRDLSQWLDDSFFIVHFADGPKVCYPARVEDVYGEQMIFRTEEGSKKGSLEDVDLTFPVLGWVNSPWQGVTHIARWRNAGDRTYSRGLRPAWLTSHTYDAVAKRLVAVGTSASWEHLNSVFFPTYPKTMREAAAVPDVALSPTCAVLGGLAYIGLTVVGRVSVENGRMSVVATGSYSCKPFIRTLRKLEDTCTSLN